MTIQDEFILNIHANGSRYYYKNGLIHRESGPAIINPLDKDKYFYTNDVNLYTTNLLPESEPFYLKEDDLWEYPIYLSIRTSYFINGIEYSQKEFEARKLKKELDNELLIKEFENRKTKV